MNDETDGGSLMWKLASRVYEDVIFPADVSGFYDVPPTSTWGEATSL